MNRNLWARRAAVLIAVAALGVSSARVAGAAAASNASLASAAPNLVAPLPSVPQGWPSTHLEVGLVDSPGGAAALHASGAYQFRYQYLCAGVNTGTGWATWNSPAGRFADLYVQESVAAGITPVFIYYQMLQSNPGWTQFSGGKTTESGADLSNLKNAATMSSYWADVRLMFQHLGAYPQKMVVDIEPDLWGHIQQASAADLGSTVPAAVASSGDPDVSGLPNDATGFAQAFVRLRNKYAPNVLLGYELSMWGTNTDPISQHIQSGQIDALAARSTAFQLSLGAGFDLVFTDPSDRDADFKKIIYGDGGNSWWGAADYDNFNRYVGDFVRGVGLRMVLWQIPLGNTKMLAMNDSWGHYQDNHVEWWFDDPGGTHLAATANAGVVAMLFGGGASGTTSAADAMGDGVTNPPAINGNNIASYSADDDGGYFRHQVNAYYAGGSQLLPGTVVVTATYHAVSPTRILDTRNGTGGPAVPLSSHVARTFQVTGAVVPANATAVTGNLTVTQQTRDGYLFVGPSPMNNPTSSTLNFPVADDRANAVTVALGNGANAPAGSLSVTYVGSGPGTAQVIFDVTGFFTPDSTGATYHALNPARVLDSRNGTGGSAAPLSNHVSRTFPVIGGSVPSSATAVTGNLTVTQQSIGGYLYLGPAPADNPTSSTLNFPVGDDRANAVTVALGDGSSAPLGSLSVTFVGSGPGTAQVIFDVTGYFTPDGSGARYVALTPARILDTRYGTGLGGMFSSHVARTLAVAGLGSIPSGATAMTGNLTVTGQTRNGYLYIGPGPANDPTSSTLNFPLGDDRANAVTVALGDGTTGPAGTASITYVGSGPGTSQVILDVSGYFTP
jgi:hypothetical protein